MCHAYLKEKQVCTKVNLVRDFLLNVENNFQQWISEKYPGRTKKIHGHFKLKFVI